MFYSDVTVRVFPIVREESLYFVVFEAQAGHDEDDLPDLMALPTSTGIIGLSHCTQIKSLFKRTSS